MSRPAVANTPPNGQDFPQDLAGRKLLIKELFDAMVNCDKARENMVRLWEGREYELFADEAPRHMSRVKNTPPVLLEMMCWQLLCACIGAQDGNLSAIRPYATFRQRFDKIKNALLNRKAFIDHMTEEQFIWKLAIAPEKSTSWASNDCRRWFVLTVFSRR